MNKIIQALVLTGATLFLLSDYANAQAIYGPQGQYLGYQQTSPSGVTTTYNTSGQSVGSSQVDNGQRSYYSPSGRYEGVTTSPSYNVPNTSIDTPRQIPQMRSVGGW